MQGQFFPITVSRGRRIASVGLALGHFAMAMAYSVPSLSIARPGTLPPGAVSVVNYIDSNGPWWIIGYGLSGLAIAVALCTARGLQWSHASGAVVCGAYSTAAFIGAFSSEPIRPIIVGTAFAMAMASHLGLSESYGDMVVRR
jgi:hypothetical protein